METYICPRHKEEIQKKATCPRCEAYLLTAPSIELMTAEERIAEFDWWLAPDMGMLTSDYEMFMDRICALVGRGIWVHELCYPDELRAEIGREKPAHEIEEDMIRRAQRLAGDKVMMWTPDTDELLPLDCDTSSFDGFIETIDMDGEGEEDEC